MFLSSSMFIFKKGFLHCFLKNKVKQSWLLKLVMFPNCNSLNQSKEQNMQWHYLSDENSFLKMIIDIYETSTVIFYINVWINFNFTTFCIHKVVNLLFYYFHYNIDCLMVQMSSCFILFHDYNIPVITNFRKLHTALWETSNNISVLLHSHRNKRKALF